MSVTRRIQDGGVGRTHASHLGDEGSNSEPQMWAEIWL
mgnify:CR=1 FL=1